MTEESKDEALARGKKEGRIDAVLESHSEHLAAINGSIDRTADDLGKLAEEIRRRGVDSQRGLDELERALRGLLRDLGSEIRTLKEEQRLRDERVSTARDTLATETERRREELALGVQASDRGTRSHEYLFTRRQQLAGIAIATALAIAGLILGLK